MFSLPFSSSRKPYLRLKLSDHTLRWFMFICPEKFGFIFLVERLWIRNSEMRLKHLCLYLQPIFECFFVCIGFWMIQCHINKYKIHHFILDQFLKQMQHHGSLNSTTRRNDMRTCIRKALLDNRLCLFVFCRHSIGLIMNW